ncbi:MAG: ribonuclease Y [Candidatus Omnitrophota bacterium]
MNISSISLIIGALIFGTAAFIGGFLARKSLAEKAIRSAETKAKILLEDAQREAENKRKETVLEAKDTMLKLRTDFEKETKDRRVELANIEKRLMQREETLERKADLIDKKEKDVTVKEKAITTKEAALDTRAQELEAVLSEEKQRLQRISGLSADEAKKLLMEKVRQDAEQEIAVMTKRMEDRAKEEADKKACEIITQAIQRCAAEHTVESTVSVVNLPSDEMKGRIIGREGRNIRALEVATGVDVIIDDTPGAVTLSSFDGVRREIAKVSLERLIQDGRIHPGRIEEIVEKAKKDIETSIKEEGERAAMEAGVHGLHPELIKLLGRLKYRTSFGQNVLQHSKEVSYLMSVMAGELKLDVAIARRAGLIHDIGKALTHEVEGPHALIGAEIAKKYGESQVVLHAIEAHNEDVEMKSTYAVLTNAADAVSASRPGARRDTLESYIKRLEKLEAIAESFKGVDKSYAIQAGREIRVIVQPDKITDEAAIALAREITKKIEETLEYPGQIKVIVIRETRAVEYAK